MAGPSLHSTVLKRRGKQRAPANLAWPLKAHLSPLIKVAISSEQQSRGKAAQSDRPEGTGTALSGLSIDTGVVFARAEAIMLPHDATASDVTGRRCCMHGQFRAWDKAGTEQAHAFQNLGSFWYASLVVGLDGLNSMPYPS